MSTVFECESGAGGRREVSQADLLDARDEEAVFEAEYRWIKALRSADVDGMPLRRRFTVRGDSLWWFAELYLHKQQVIRQVCRTIAALERLVERERPAAIRLASGGRVAAEALYAFGRARGVPTDDAPGGARLRLARMDLRARGLMLAASGGRLRPGRAASRPAKAAVATFVHRAFWRTGGDGDEESYIGPALRSLEERLPDGAVRYIGIGPPANFRARRWWHALRSAPQRVEPIEAFAPTRRLKDSAATWRERHVHRRALWGSPAVRAHAVIHGCDCWPIVREELAGVALLQWPWSVRAMDEAAAAMETLEPRVVLTYAEAGGWGRALMLEARRRGIPSAGLQHGFIYRHWLNYRHEADEMVPDPAHQGDQGFPRPSLTLLFDGYAAGHLEHAGCFPADALRVTGSPRLDALAEAVRRLTPADVLAVRAGAGARPRQALVLMVSKEREARGVLPALVSAVAGRPDVHLAIKAHPAETPDVYSGVTAGQPNVRVLGPSVPLAPLMAASRAVVTVNSTVALDAAVLAVPALVIGLPNNLSPFVDAGAMAGASTPAEIGGQLVRILYDDEFRQQIDRARREFLTRFAIGADGGAAARAAEAIVEMAGQ